MSENLFGSKKLWVGNAFMLLSVIWAAISLCLDIWIPSEFGLFSASGAVMVAGSILSERLKPGVGLDGGDDFMSLPSIDQTYGRFDDLLRRYSGHVSIVVLLCGTLIWAYGGFFVSWILAA